MLSLLAETYTYTYTTVNGADETGFWAFFAGLWLFALAVWVVSIVALWKVFEKAGIPGWKAIIPIYNAWLLFEMAGKPGWWALVSLGAIIPFIGIIAGIASFVLYCIAALELGKAFGKSTAFTVVALIIFNVVGLLILGFGPDKYTKPATAPAKFS
jgi:hypothetical protein